MELTHLPQPRTLQDYQDALDRYLKITDQVGASKTVYQFGTFGSQTAPGLSDIDLVVMVDEKITHRETLGLSIKNLSKDDQEIFLHDPIVVSEKTSSIVFETTGVQNFSRVGGDDCSSLQISETPPNDYQKWAMTLEYVPWYVSSIQGFLVEEDVDARWAIPILRSIKYLLRDNSDLKSQFSFGWEKFSEDVKFICDNWFKFSYLELRDRLKLVLQKAWKIIVDVAWARDAELANANHFLADRDLLKPTSLMYSPNERVVVAKKKPENFRSYQDAKLLYALPPSCFLMLDVYQTAGGLQTKFLNTLSCQSWSGLAPDTEFELYLAKRVALFNKHLEFLNRKGVDFGQSVTNFIYNPCVMKNKSAIARSEIRVLATLSKFVATVPIGQVCLTKLHMIMP